jgi:anaphase-promoting complex subunit 2
MPGRILNARKQRVFESVFGGAANISQPTPVATPATGFTTPGQTFGGPFLANHHNYPTHLPRTRGPSLQKGNSLDASDHVQDQVKWDRSWHLVTHTLALSDFPENRVVLESLKPERESVSSEFYGALEDILYPQVCLPFARQTEDIVAWHTSQVKDHFLHQVLPLILRLRDEYVPETLLIKAVKILETAHRQYLHGLSFIKEQIDNSVPDTSMPVVDRFRRDLYAVISNSVTEPLSDALSKVLRAHVQKVLGLSATNGASNLVIAAEGIESEKARREMLVLVESFKNVGLAGERFQVIFAEIMNHSMTDYISRGCRGVWSPDDMAKHSFFKDETGSRTDRHGSILPRIAPHSPLSRCVTDLCQWIEQRYAKLAVQVLSLLDAKVNVTWADKEKYKEMAMGRLADLRTRELFDIVVNWPRSRGALDDLRTAITTPQRRLHLTEVFAKTLSRKILHPGASTLLVLQTYISMIWSFHALDHSKVLLDRVAYPLQLYLCSREDTVRIIITGLLSDAEDSQGDSIKSGGDKLVELAQLLSTGSEQIGQRVNDEELDWHDMEWIPDPVDAGPGYKRSKNADIIGTLIGVLGSQDLFIKEFQNIIGENLLRHEGSFEKEVSSLARFCCMLHTLTPYRSRCLSY